jgi:hypothetical protein
MKKLIQSLAVILTAVFLFNGCKKEEDKNPDDTLPEVIIGNVLLPAGSVTDANTLTVINFQDEMGVSDNAYEINALNEHTTLFVVDDNDEVIMMSYLYPGQTDFTIDARSTTLALLMNMPFSFQIGTDGKTAFTNKILGDADFQNIVTATEDLLIQGISPFDTTQTAYAIQLSQYLVDVSTQKAEQTNGAPAQILRDGKVLTIQNAGKSYATAVGIYRNGSKVKSFELDRIKFVPTSEAQTLAAINGSYLLPDVISSEPYTMQDDADYEIRVRNGNAKLNGIIDWSSDENRAAHIKNTKNFCIDVVTNVLPLDGCLLNITNSLYGFIDNFFNAANAKEISVASTYDLSKSWFSFVGNGLSCLTQSLSWARFKLIVKKYFWWTAWVQRLGTVGNQVVGIAQMQIDESALDTCFNVVGNTVTPGQCLECTLCANNASGDFQWLVVESGDFIPITGATNQCLDVTAVVGAHYAVTVNLNQSIDTLSFLITTDPITGEIICP